MSNVTAINAAPATSAQFRITASIKGFPVEIAFEGKAENLLALIERLEKIGACPPSSIAPAAASRPVPVCPVHNKPMKPSKKPGSFFCPGRNADGSYCDEKA